MADCLFVAIGKLIILGTVLNYIRADQGCKYTNSTMDCIQMSGQILNPDPGIEINIIRFYECNLSALTKEDFSKFSNVHIISIFNSTLLFPAQGSLFSGLQDLREINILSSDVTEQVGIAFADNRNIHKVSLTGNKISAIPKNFFSHLKLVEEIDLSNNQIIQIESGAFEGLSSLTFLNLSSNFIGSSFDTRFLILASSKCAVCRETISVPECTFDDLNRCEESKAFDQLWWISISVNVHIEKNPICSLAMEKENAPATIADGIPLKSPKDKERCKVYERGHCFKHESRYLFLLQACGFKIIPSQVEEWEDGIISQSEIKLSKNTVSSTQPNEGTRIIRIASLHVIPIAIAIFIVTLIIGAILSAVIRKLLIKENSTKKHQYEPIVNTQTAIEVEGLPLHEAARRGDVNEVKNLLQQGKDPNELDKNGDTPLHIAAQENKVEILDNLLKYNTDVNVTNSSGATPLIKAANKENCDAIKFLLEHGANKDASNSNGNTALHNAAYNGNRETLKMLLEKGVNIEIEDQKGKTPLYQASFTGHHDIVKLLLERGAAVNTPDHDGKTPLHIASWNGHQKVVDLLLQGNDEVNRKDKKGYTPLHNCSRKGHIEVLKHLLQKNNLDINITDGESNTPLHHAASGGSIEVLNILLEKEADPNKYNKDNKTPLMVAEEAGNQVFAKKLKQRLRTNPASVHSN